jgi:hypothetical protein
MRFAVFPFLFLKKSLSTLVRTLVERADFAKRVLAGQQG